jgi:hypothetical protein
MLGRAGVQTTENGVTLRCWEPENQISLILLQAQEYDVLVVDGIAEARARLLRDRKFGQTHPYLEVMQRLRAYAHSENKIVIASAHLNHKVTNANAISAAMIEECPKIAELAENVIAISHLQSEDGVRNDQFLHCLKIGNKAGNVRIPVLRNFAHARFDSDSF